MARKKKRTPPPPARRDLNAARQKMKEMADQNDGLVNPLDVVDEAEHPASPFHDYFTWDNDEAGPKLRLIEAGMLIRRFRFRIVQIVPETKSVEVRILREFHSLPDDRHSNGGYRTTESIFDDPALRKKLELSVLRDLEYLQRKYGKLSGLAPVWDSIGIVRERLRAA